MTDQLANEQTSRGKIIIEKLQVAQLVKKFPAFNGT
jgi:hypothetical protein